MARYYTVDTPQAPTQTDLRVGGMIEGANMLANALNSVRAREAQDFDRKQEHDYKQGMLGVHRDKLNADKQKQAKDAQSAKAALALFNVNTEEDVKVGDNQEERNRITTFNKGNEEIRNKYQGAYDRVYNSLKLANATEEKAREGADAAGRSAAKIDSIDKYAAVAVPAFEELFEKRNISSAAYGNKLKGIMENMDDVSPATIALAGSLLDGYMKTEAKDKERRQDAQYITDLNKLYNSKPGEVVDFTNKDAAKDSMNYITKRDQEPKTKKGPGPLTQEAIYETGLKDVIDTDYSKKLIDKIKNENINVADADLASYIKSANKDWFQSSKTQYKRIEQMLDALKNK